MRNTRKGFTLVELLIVVAILATLTATMMVSMRGATAKAKAASIAANLESCHTAAMLYYAASGDKDLSSVGAEEMLTVNLKTWSKLKGGTGDAITYTAIGNGPDKWSVNVDFSKDSEAKDIARALNAMRGYSNVTLIAFDSGLGFDIFGATPAYAEDTEKDGKLFMNLITGQVFVGNTTDGDISSLTYDSTSNENGGEQQQQEGDGNQQQQEGGN